MLFRSRDPGHGRGGNEMVDLIPIKRLYQYENLKRVDSSEGRRYVGVLVGVKD